MGETCMFNPSAFSTADDDTHFQNVQQTCHLMFKSDLRILDSTVSLSFLSDKKRRMTESKHPSRRFNPAVSDVSTRTSVRRRLRRHIWTTSNFLLRMSVSPLRFIKVTTRRSNPIPTKYAPFLKTSLLQNWHVLSCSTRLMNDFDHMSFTRKCCVPLLQRGSALVRTAINSMWTSISNMELSWRWTSESSFLSFLLN